MSLPATGEFSATLQGMNVSFDGESWASDSRDFDQLAGPALAAETPRHAGHHLTVDEVGRRVLQALFPGAWQETRSRSDTWANEIPDTAVD